MIRKFALGAVIMLAALGGTAGAAAAAPVSMAAAPARITTATLTSAVTPAANDCGLPAQADPGSYFVRSYSSCWVCEFVALEANTDPDIPYYCTYNPSNGLTDLHFDIL